MPPCSETVTRDGLDSPPDSKITVPKSSLPTENTPGVLMSYLTTSAHAPKTNGPKPITGAYFAWHAAEECRAMCWHTSKC